MIQHEKQSLNSPDFIALNILREFVYELTNVNLENIQKVILFGSYAKKTYGQNSDIDTAIIIKEKNPNDEILVAEIIDRLKKRFGKEIQPHYFTENEFETHNKKAGLEKEIARDGVILL